MKFRYQSRGGYTSLDDAGIVLKKDHPHILNALATGNVFDLDIGECLTFIGDVLYSYEVSKVDNVMVVC